LNIVDPELLRLAAAAAAGGQQYPPGCLYIVATPIGNLADLTLRAIHVLSRVDVVACEDTRVSATLLRHLGLDKPLLALHAHNEQQASAAVLERLARGESVACVSDAGTPAISDPGAALVARAAAAGHRVVPVPGASSATAAVSVAGDVLGHGYRFVGFLPAKGAERRDALAASLADAGSVVLFEAPHRIEALFSALAGAAPARAVTVCRELTKQFETVATMPAAELPGWLAADANRERGEFVVVLHGVPATASDELPADVLKTLNVLLRELPLKQAVALAAELTGAPRNALYDEALRLRT
jgi:16S rRNA (cytidine1402-2'-O)-methyltransferase